jgi:spore coat protein CotH
MMIRRHRRALFVAGVALACVLGLPWPSAAQPPAVPDETAPFFDDSVVHDLYFAVNNKDWQTLKDNYLDNTYYPVDFKWQGIIVRNAGIRSRGTGSRSGAKPGLRLDFDRYTSNQKFLGLKSIVLRNSTQDPSNVHERLSMLLFRKLGLVAPRETYARLFVNNVYAGLYAVVESIDKTFLANNFGNDEGYLYKYDYTVGDPAYYMTYRTSDPADYVPHPFKPETHETDPHGDVIERMVWTVNNATDAGFRAAISAYLDLTDFVKHVASEVFVADNDGFIGNWGMNNYYIYRLPANNQFRFIKWDKSEAFKDTPDYWIWHNHLDAPDPSRNRLWNRVMAQPDLKTLFLDTLVECARLAQELPSDAAATDTRGWLVTEVDKQANLIRAAVVADTTRPYTTDQFEAAVGFTRQFALMRPDFVRTQVAASR